MIRFRRGVPTELNESVPKVVLINSHDGSSSYQLLAGIYRLVCLNGPVVGHDYQSVNVRHSGKAAAQVIEGSFEVMEQATRALPRIEQMQQTLLTPDERMMLAISQPTCGTKSNSIGIPPNAAWSARFLVRSLVAANPSYRESFKPHEKQSP